MPEFILSYLQNAKVWLLAGGLRIFLVILLAFVVLKVVKSTTRRIFERLSKNQDEEFKKRMNTLASLISFTLAASIMVISLVLVLGELGIDIGPILAAAGVVGLAVGFGAQQLVQDVISGFFIFLEDQIRVGDVVETAGKSGLVEKVTLRMTILRDLSGNVHYIRNGRIDVVTNMTKDYSRYVFDIGVAYRENVDRVIEAIKAVDEDMRADPELGPAILEPIEILGLDRFADSAVIIRARTTTKPIMQWTVGREFNKRLKAKFDAGNIEIPFPHRTIYFGVDTDGNAPAMRLRKAREAGESG